MKKLLKGLPSAEKNFDWDRGLFMLSANLPFECNYSCPKCAFVGDKSTRHISIGRKMGLLSEASQLGARTFILEGEGEPLMFEDFEALITQANKKGLTSVVFTNGYFLGGEQARFLFDRDVSLIVSLDSLDKRVYDTSTNTRENLQRVLTNLDNARKLYSGSLIRRTDSVTTRLALSSLISLQTMGELDKISGFCGEDVMFLANVPLYEGSAKANWKFLTGMEGNPEQRYNPLFFKLREQYSQGPIPICKRPIGGCASLLNGLEVRSDGDVLFCAGTRDSYLGNVVGTSLADLWTKKREFIQKYSLTELTCLPRDKPALYDALARRQT